MLDTGARKGIEVVARNTELMSPLFIFSIVLLGLLLIPSIKMEQLKPQVVHGMYRRCPNCRLKNV
ncbi:hypothetical protein [Ammoniphilus sp. 3BR4]|uniref:hypothetical protein n=1 Tax=Ammoniphilus sp. 3BR4 TaxID=3158265 RepID=UPI003465D0C8